MQRKRRIPGFLPLIIIGIALVGLAVMLLWNAIVSPVLHVEEINYWQAVGLLVLCRILTGGFRGRPGPPFGRGQQWRGGPPWRDNWKNMSEEDRAKFGEEWKKRCGRKPAE